MTPEQAADFKIESIKILYLAAESFLVAGDPITIGGDIDANLPVVLGLIAADPRFRAGVLAAYRAGREDAAKATAAIPEHPEMVPNAAEEWQNGFRWGWHYAVKAVREAITQGQQQREGT